MSGVIDYFNPKDVHYEYTFPDKITKVVFRKLTEGDRAFLQNQRSTLRLDRRTQIMEMDAGSGTFKVEVLERAMVDWTLESQSPEGNMVRVPFNRSNVKQLLEKLDPSIVDEMFNTVVSYNSWLDNNKDSVQSLKERIDALKEEMDQQEAEEKK